MTGDAGGTHPPPGRSPWWSDALADPWRNPDTPTEIRIPAREPEDTAPTESMPALESTPLTARRAATMLISVVVALLIGGALGGALGYLSADRDPGPRLGADPEATILARDPPQGLAAVAERVLPSVVTIYSSDQRRERTLGSGFVVTEDGYVITNDHVMTRVTGAVSVTFHDGTRARATLVGQDPESDIAVLQVDRDDLIPVRIGDSDTVSVGDPVLAFGSPLDLTNTVTFGIVSATDRTIEAGDPGGPVRYYAAIQTDAAVNQGNSGGPLVDTDGRVIGVNSVIKSFAASGIDGGNIGLAFAIPIRQAERVATEIIERGRASRTVLGAELDRDNDPSGGGVRLREVVRDGPADEAGLRADDVVTRLDGRVLEGPTDLVALVRRYDPGTEVTVHFRRGGSETTTTVTLVADPG